MEIGALLLLSERMPASELERLLAQRLLLHQRFRQTVVEAAFPPLRPHWQSEPNFALSAHMASFERGPALSEVELAQRVSEQLSQRLTFRRSPWRMDLFPLAEGGSALFFRVHHCIADGLALVRLLDEISDVPSPAQPRRIRTPRARETSAWQAARQLVPKAPEIASTLLGLAAAHADPGLELHTPSGVKRVAWSSRLELARLSQTAEALGCHLTELVLAASAEALAAGLSAGTRPLPRRLHALVPFAASLGRRELGNHYASTFVELVLDEPDPFRRIARMMATTRKLRDPAQARLALGLVGLSGLLAPPLMRRAIDRFSRRATLALSNVKGPAQPLRLCGRALRSVIVFAPASASMGVSLTLFGYAGALRLGVETDAASPLLATQLVADFEKALARLSQGVGRA